MQQINCPIKNNLINYTTAVLRTAKPMPGRENLFHAMVGIATEVDEIQEVLTQYNWEDDLVQAEAHLGEELGDVLWYIALGLHYLNVSTEEVAQFLETVDYDGQKVHDLQKPATKLLNFYKKERYYGKAIADADIRNQLLEVYARCEAITEYMCVDLAEIMQANANKLAVRYAEAWSLSECEGRNLDAEVATFWTR